MNIATKLITALAVSAAMTSVVISGEPDASVNKPVVLASLIIVPVDEGRPLASLGAARSLNLSSESDHVRMDNDAAGAQTPYAPGADTATLFESDAFRIYQREYELDPVPVPTPRPQFVPQQASARAVAPSARRAPVQRSERVPVRQQRMAAVPEAESASRPRLRDRPVFFGVFR